MTNTGRMKAIRYIAILILAAALAACGVMRPAQTTGMFTNCLIFETSSRLQFSGIYCGGCDQYQAS